MFRTLGGSMSALTLSLACGAYDMLSPLMEGVVRPQGIELNVQTYISPVRHRRMARHLEFDCAEYSLGSYLAWQGPDCPVIAIPVFPHRRFRHSYMFCRNDDSITDPAQLNGARVGLACYQNSASIWCRGILHDEYGVDLKSITWVTQTGEDIPLNLPPWVKLERLPEGETLDAHLHDGKLSAVFYPAWLPLEARNGSPGLRRLFPNHREVEADYYRRTGIFPVMHTVVIKKSILERHPWVAANLLQAFRESKALCYQRAADPRRYPLAWIAELREEQIELLGDDPWPFSLEENRLPLETVLRYGVEVGLVREPPKLESLFFPATLDEPKTPLA